MRRLSLQDLKKYPAVTHEGASAYDYSASHPLVHLTFTFGSALFTDGFYEKEQEQVRRFAEALVAAAAREPRFPWQYGAWVRDPREGKGNRIEGSLTPALLDALLDPTEHNEPYVERCLSHRPDDVLAFLVHYRTLGLGAPSAAARRGAARALARFDEYQLLKYARPHEDFRLCDAIAALRPELLALGSRGALALTVGRYLHTPTRERDRLLATAARGEEGLVPLPFASARRELFRRPRESAAAPGFGGAVAQARVTWEQVMGQFGRSVEVSPQLFGRLTRLASWKPPVGSAPALWRLAFFPRLVVGEQVAALTAIWKESGAPQTRSEAFLAAILRQTGEAPRTLEALPGELASAEAAGALARRLEGWIPGVRAQHGAAAVRIYETLHDVALLQHRHDAALRALSLAVIELRGSPTPGLVARVRVAAGALAESLAQDPTRGAIVDEMRGLAAQCERLLGPEAPDLSSILSSHHAGNAALTRAVGEARMIVVSTRPPLPHAFRALEAACRAYLAAVAESAKIAPREGASDALRATVERSHRKHAQAARVVSSVEAAVALHLGKVESAEIAAHNHQVWGALLAAPGLLPDLAFVRNLRNLHAAGFTVEALTELARQRAFKGIWPHQIYAGFLAEPGLEPVFEAALRTTAAARLPPGRHLGLADASGSMTAKVGGPLASIECLDVAILFTALMSETSMLGASFSEGFFWGGDSAYLALAERAPGEGILAFSKRRDLRAGTGGTHVFGAVLELTVWLKRHDHVPPPDCLWFFSDMQFHPAEGNDAKLPAPLLAEAKELGLGTGRPPLELALDLYRRHFGRVDVVLWNLSAYSPVPVASDMKGVLLPSGFDANTFSYVTRWRSGEQLSAAESTAVESQEVVLSAIRRY